MLVMDLIHHHWICPLVQVLSSAHVYCLLLSHCYWEIVLSLMRSTAIIFDSQLGGLAVFVSLRK